MMGPEAMGVANANLVWSDEKVCRNFLCGTCPHALFTNTVRLAINSQIVTIPDTVYRIENGSRRVPEITHRAS